MCSAKSFEILISSVRYLYLHTLAPDGVAFRRCCLAMGKVGSTTVARLCKSQLSRTSCERERMLRNLGIWCLLLPRVFKKYIYFNEFIYFFTFFFLLFFFKGTRFWNYIFNRMLLLYTIFVMVWMCTMKAFWSLLFQLLRLCTAFTGHDCSFLKDCFGKMKWIWVINFKLVRLLYQVSLFSSSFFSHQLPLQAKTRQVTLFSSAVLFTWQIFSPLIPHLFLFWTELNLFRLVKHFTMETHVS